MSLPPCAPRTHGCTSIWAGSIGGGRSWSVNLARRGAHSGGLTATPEERIMIMRLPDSPELDLDLPLSVEWRPGGELW